MQKLEPIVKQANMLSDTYDVVVTNPPYLGVGNMSAKLNIGKFIIPVISI